MFPSVAPGGLQAFEMLQANPQAGGSPQSQLAGWEKTPPAASTDDGRLLQFQK